MIKTCLSSAFFFLLLNGQPTSWISSFKGDRQGDPLSFFLFILFSQNLTSLLNFSLCYNMIPSFDNQLSPNFNHHMYADDLVLITQASRRVARNIKLCLHIYSTLPGQHSNLNKYGIFFQVWFNKWVAKSICSILNFKLALSLSLNLESLFLQSGLVLLILTWWFSNSIIFIIIGITPKF